MACFYRIYALNKNGVCFHQSSTDETALKNIIVERYESMGFVVNVDEEN